MTPAGMTADRPVTRNDFTPGYTEISLNEPDGTQQIVLRVYRNGMTWEYDGDMTWRELRDLFTRAEAVRRDLT